MYRTEYRYRVVSSQDYPDTPPVIDRGGTNAVVAVIDGAGAGDVADA